MNTEPNYSNMEEVLKLINSKYIALDENQKEYNVRHLLRVLDLLIGIMKAIDPLFLALYSTNYFGGSYYDGLKIEKPNEFDIDLLLSLSTIICVSCKRRRCGCVRLCPSNKPGWLWLKIKDGFCPSLKVFMKDGFVETNLVLNWLKGLVYKALPKLAEKNVEVKTNYWSESGPALTLMIRGEYGDIDVDLVPSFTFNKGDWPLGGYIDNPTSKWEFFIVPKYNETQRYWRASFQAQESILIWGKEKLKPSLKLLKKMRNSLDHRFLASYFLKTIALNNLKNIKWTGSLSEAFMPLLYEYQECLKSGQIPYYWNRKNNLLGMVRKDILENEYNRISKQIRKIEQSYKTDPCIIASIILTPEEYNVFKNDSQAQMLCGVSQASLPCPEEASGWVSIFRNLETPSTRDQSNSAREHRDQEQPSTSTSSGGTSWWQIGTIAAAGLIAGAVGGVLYRAFREENEELRPENRPANSRRNSNNQNR